MTVNASGTTGKATAVTDGNGFFVLGDLPAGPGGVRTVRDLDRLLEGAKIFAFTAMSNVLGTITPIRRLVDAAHAAGALALADGCQYVPHHPTERST